MSELNLSVESPEAAQETTTVKSMPGEKRLWQTPKMEDVSEEVMAQPYIRFT